VQGSPFGGFAPSSEEQIAQSQIDVRAGAWTQPQIDVEATRKKIFDAFPQSSARCR